MPKKKESKFKVVLSIGAGAREKHEKEGKTIGEALSKIGPVRAFGKVIITVSKDGKSRDFWYKPILLQKLLLNPNYQMFFEKKASVFFN